MRRLPAFLRGPAPRIDAGLLLLRLGGAFMLFMVHGRPKLLHYAEELLRIEDPFGLGPHIGLWFAIFAEVLCPLLIALGIFTRLACLPILAVLLIALVAVHPDWSLEEGQFAWLLLILFGTLALTGPGRWALANRH
jgi:putative oxidoreductase